MNFLLDDQMRVTVLASGSRGNVTLIECGRQAILIDAGISGRRLRKLLLSTWGPPETLSGCFLTHEHMDHARGLKTLFAGEGGEWIRANSQTREYLASRGMDTRRWKDFQTGEEVICGVFSVRSFPVPHDAYDPCGFQVRAGGRTAVICTDLGYVTAEVKEQAGSADIFVLEANYDEALLAADSKRPWSTKQRIMARHGHLSNAQAGDLLAGLSGSRLKHVLLAHLSEDCNRPELAVSAAREGIRRAGLEGVNIHPASQSAPTIPVVV